MDAVPQPTPITDWFRVWTPIAIVLATWVWYASSVNTNINTQLSGFKEQLTQLSNKIDTLQNELSKVRDEYHEMVRHDDRQDSEISRLKEDAYRPPPTKLR